MREYNIICNFVCINKGEVMRREIKKLIDLKSIITLTLVITLEILVVTFAFTKGTLDEKLFLLFSNVTTMVITYYFTKKSINTDDGKNLQIRKEENKDE